MRLMTVYCASKAKVFFKVLSNCMHVMHARDLNSVVLVLFFDWRLLNEIRNIFGCFHYDCARYFTSKQRNVYL